MAKFTTLLKEVLYETYYIIIKQKKKDIFLMVDIDVLSHLSTLFKKKDAISSFKTIYFFINHHYVYDNCMK